MNSYTKQVDNITITVDFKTELLGIIEIISPQYKSISGHTLTPLGNKFIYDNIIEKFNKYSNHELIELFDEITQKYSFMKDSLVHMFLELGDDLKIDKLSDYTMEQLNYDNKIYEFINLLPSFASEIGFYDYYKNNENFYLKCINSISNNINDIKFSKFLSNYFGYLNKELVINAIPFNSYSCYSAHTDKKVISSLGITQLSKSEDLYGTWELYKGDMIQICNHEFCHSYINPLTEKYDLSDITMFDNIKEQMLQFGYDDIATIINEHVVRAVEIRSIKQLNLGEEKYKNSIERYKNIGFIYIEQIIELLEQYETKRNEYKTFDMFYDNIINYMKQNKKRDDYNENNWSKFRN